jgi:hypothetical protein
MVSEQVLGVGVPVDRAARQGEVEVLILMRQVGATGLEEVEVSWVDALCLGQA